jgi:short-subunit dehydrogenase
VSNGTRPGTTTVLVTGASSGIGRAAAHALADRGCRLLLTGRQEQALSETSSRTAGSSLAVDLLQDGAVAGLADWADEVGPPDVVVHAAGIGLARAAASTTPADTEPVMRLNLAVPVELTGRLLGGMLARGRGRVLFVTSIAALVGVPGESAYAASKAAVHHYARCLRSELATSPVSVATLAPAVVDTPFFDRRAEPYTRRVPRPLPVEKVGDAVATLALGTAAEVVVPRWMRLPALVQAVAPTSYARLAGRLG